MEWQPIETAPMDGSWVLLWDNGRCVIGKWQQIVGSYWAWDANASGAPAYEIEGPTHWMPLPDPPAS